MWRNQIKRNNTTHTQFVCASQTLQCSIGMHNINSPNNTHCTVCAHPVFKATKCMYYSSWFHRKDEQQGETKRRRMRIRRKERKNNIHTNNNRELAQISEPRSIFSLRTSRFLRFTLLFCFVRILNFNLIFWLSSKLI